MVPICVEESLPNGCAQTCAPFLVTATEYFLKEVLSNIYQRTRVNMPSGSVNSVLTHHFKGRFQLEEDLATHGGIGRVGGPGGLLPVEAREAANRKPVNMGDLKLSMRMSDSNFGQFPFVRAKVWESSLDGELDEIGRIRARQSIEEKEENERRKRTDAMVKALTNGVHVNGFHDPVLPNGLTNGVHPQGDDDDDFGWEGGSKSSRHDLASAIDDVLNIGT